MLQRILANAMAFLIGEDVQLQCATDQVCAGTKAGVKAAAHAMVSTFEECSDDEEILLMDARNAFNAVSRTVAL